MNGPLTYMFCLPYGMDSEKTHHFAAWGLGKHVSAFAKISLSMSTHLPQRGLRSPTSILRITDFV